MLLTIISLRKPGCHCSCAYIKGDWCSTSIKRNISSLFSCNEQWNCLSTHYLTTRDDFVNTLLFHLWITVYSNTMFQTVTGEVLVRTSGITYRFTYTYWKKKQLLIHKWRISFSDVSPCNLLRISYQITMSIMHIFACTVHDWSVWYICKYMYNHRHYLSICRIVI